ncbi:MAG: hypothetical protein ACI8RZ_003223 [Myxococcota bacterium]|jgi:hypothetical protein
MADDEDSTEEIEQLNQALSPSKATPATNAMTGNAVHKDKT